MTRRFPLALPLALTLGCVLALVAVPAVAEESDPSSCAEGMPGASGAFDFRPPDWMEGVTSYWIDTDGIAPGIAGCHVGVDEEGEPNDRMFGEDCLPNGLLVESNPNAYIVHSHSNDVGGPDTFDCDVWCMATEKKPGVCMVVGEGVAPPCAASAKCACG